MAASELSTFIVVYLVLAFGLSVFAWLRRRSRTTVFVVVAAGLVASATLVVFLQLRTPVVLTDEILTGWRSHRNSTILAGLCAAAASLPWFGLLWLSADKDQKRTLFAIPILLCGLIGTVGGFGMYLFDQTNDLQMPNARMFVDGFVIEEITTFDVNPIRLAVDEKHQIAYVSYYSDDERGIFDGGVHQVSTVLVDGKPNRPRLAVSSPILYRPFGLAVRDGEIYVSRTGLFSSARDGQLTHPSLAAVTRISDLDNNGIFEYFDDVILDLPGARSPDVQHQNNGIAFDDEGNLFLAIGSNDDRTLDDHPWGGTILKASADFETVDVFARGLRNPFGLALAPDEVIYVTDNDVRSNRGDEVNAVRRGLHYGHPFVAGIDKVGKGNGFEDPMWMSAPNANLNGIAYLGASFNEYDGCVLVVDRPGSKITLIRPKQVENRTELGEAKLFARLQNPVDIVATKNGEIYVASRDYQKLYRIRRR